MRRRQSTSSKSAELLTAHLEQLRVAENYPPTLRQTRASIGRNDEIARIEKVGPLMPCMRCDLYGRLQSARENSFVQNEALAHEVAAGLLGARLRDDCPHVSPQTRDCYDRWGALILFNKKS